MVAKKITLNGPIPPAASVLPKGVVWKKKAFDDADFVNDVWAFKKQTDPASVPPATVAQFAVHYLASAEATTEFRAMQGDASGTSEDSPDEGAEPDDSGN